MGNSAHPYHGRHVGRGMRLKSKLRRGGRPISLRRLERLLRKRQTKI